jgi:hypothetical protein
MSIFKYIVMCLLQLKEEFFPSVWVYARYVYIYVKRTTFQTSALVIDRQQLRVECYKFVILLHVYICFNFYKCYKRTHVVMLKKTSILLSET